LVREAGMQRLSSRSRFFFKRVYPAFCFGALAHKPDPVSTDIIPRIDALRLRRAA